jgi:general stress protein YciG
MAESKGKGWHGDPQGHAKAGRMSSGKFKPGSDRARMAGKKGGQAAQKGRGHKLTKEERARGGRNSRSGGRKRAEA